MNNTQRVEEIRRRLTAAFSPTHLQVIDESDQHIGHAGAASGAGHFAVSIRAEAFAGRSRLQRHRMIHGVLADLMEKEIHALRIKSDN